MSAFHSVIVGGGFAGFHAARSLSRLARHLGGHAGGIEIVLINPTDYFREPYGESSRG